MFEAGVEHFLDPVQLRTPHVPEIIQPLVEGGEPPVDGLLKRRKSLINRRKPLVHAYETLLHGSLYSVNRAFIYARRSPISPALNNIGMPMAK
jgi:hypothetical protein